MSLRCNPTIFHTTGSIKCQNIAKLLTIELDSNFKSNKNDFPNNNAMLMIIDRNKDRLTPLKMPFYYQSLIFEHLEYHAGRVNYGGLSNKEVSVTELHDAFFSSRLFDHFGQVVSKSVAFVKKMSEVHKEHKENLGGSLAQMEFVAEQLPEIKKKTNLSTKHFEIVELLTEKIRQHKLIDIEKVETEIIDTKLGLHTFDVSADDDRVSGTCCCPPRSEKWTRCGSR